jgi:hypothetical protein
MVSAFNAHALGALAEVAGPGLDFHLGTVLPPLLSGMSNVDQVENTHNLKIMHLYTSHLQFKFDCFMSLCPIECRVLFIN